MKLAFGYNTNGFAHHRLGDALAIIADCGYDGIALTLDVHHLDPFRATKREVAALRRQLHKLKLRCVIETGARYLLDPRHKHEPTLISSSPAGRRLRITFLCRAIETAAYLGAEAVSFWSGARCSDASEAKAWEWLVDGSKRVRDYAAEKGVALGFEPEPGMLVATMADYERLRRAIVGRACPPEAGKPPRGESRNAASVTRPTPDIFGLTLDVGHVFCTERDSFSEIWRRYAPYVRNVHIEDIRGRQHEHRMFGEGELDFQEIFASIKASGYRGLINVELSRDSHRAPEVAERSIQFLRQIKTSL